MCCSKIYFFLRWMFKFFFSFERQTHSRGSDLQTSWVTMNFSKSSSIIHDTLFHHMFLFFLLFPLSSFSTGSLFFAEAHGYCPLDWHYVCDVSIHGTLHYAIFPIQSDLQYIYTDTHRHFDRQWGPWQICGELEKNTCEDYSHVQYIPQLPLKRFD